MADPSRVLLSVAPRVFSDTLEMLLQSSDAGDVVCVPPGAVAEGSFDVAIVMSAIRPDAGVVIDLTDAARGQARITRHGAEEIIDLEDVSHIVRLLTASLSPEGDIGVPVVRPQSVDGPA